MNNLYNLSIDENAALIQHVADKRTVIVQGDMGFGKTSIGQIVADALGFPLLRLDCTNMTISDLMCPWPDRERGCVDMMPNEQLGLHEAKPMVIMVDEIGKSTPDVLNAFNGIFHEREFCGYKFHPETRIFGTTNKGAEGLGDILPAHTRNRMIVTTMRPHTADEMLAYGVKDGWDSIVLGFIREYPQVLQVFDDVRNPDDNPYINHPQAVGREACTTPRSLHMASDLLKTREHISENALTGALIGTIGQAAALDMAAFIKLASQIPSRAAVRQEPDTCVVPDSASAQNMVVFRELGCIESQDVKPVMTFIKRLPRESQFLFVKSVMADTYPDDRKKAVTTNKLFQDWCLENHALLTGDKV